MNGAQLEPGLFAMLDTSNFPIEPGALMQQNPMIDTDTASSRTTSTTSAPRLPTPDTEADDSFFEGDQDYEDDTPKKPTTRRTRNKMPSATATKSKPTTTSPRATKTAAKGKKTAGAADKRRKRNLERNRAAASKCRQRKKQWQDGLERRKMELEGRYKALHSESKELMEEVAQLKNFVMAHAACNDANIDDWIRNEADNFVRRMSTTAHLQNGAAAAAAGLPNASAQGGGGVSMQQQSSAQAAPALDASLNGEFELTSQLPFQKADQGFTDLDADALSNMFASPASKPPYDNTNNQIRAGTDNNTLFNQDLLLNPSIPA